MSEQMNITTIAPVITNRVKASLDFNYDEIKATIEREIGHFDKEVVTENTIQDGKKMRTGLKKLDEKLNRTRIDEPKLLLEKIEPFQNKLKELSDYVMGKHQHIDTQIKKFEKQQKEEKEVEVKLLITQTQEENELKEKYLVQVELKSEYMNSSMSLNKVKADVLEQFKMLKMQQDMEDQKIFTIHSILEAYNEKLKFKYAFVDFAYLLETDKNVLEISEIVKNKVEVRLAEEKEELERIEAEKQQAIKDAEAKVKEDARLEAERVERQAKSEEERKEREHQAELKRIETDNIEKERVIREQAQAEVVRATKTITETVNKFVPAEAKEEATQFNITMKYSATQEQFDAIKEYFKASGINAKFKIEA